MIYKNCGRWRFCAANSFAGNLPVRTSCGWRWAETARELTRWAGRNATTNGRLAGANLYLRGRGLLSPTNHDGSPVEINEIDNRVRNRTRRRRGVRPCATEHAAPPDGRRRCEIEGGPDTVVNVTVNVRTRRPSRSFWTAA
ncbi:MAG: hypothetical protein ACLR7U_07015 [Ruthenibacterium lactatiformans]